MLRSNGIEPRAAVGADDDKLRCAAAEAKADEFDEAAHRNLPSSDTYDDDATVSNEEKDNSAAATTTGPKSDEFDEAAHLNLPPSDSYYADDVPEPADEKEELSDGAESEPKQANIDPSPGAHSQAISECQHSRVVW